MQRQYIGVKVGNEQVENDELGRQVGGWMGGRWVDKSEGRQTGRWTESKMQRWMESLFSGKIVRQVEDNELGRQVGGWIGGCWQAGR